MAERKYTFNISIGNMAGLMYMPLGRNNPIWAADQADKNLLSSLFFI